MDAEARDLLAEIERIHEAAKKAVRKAGDAGVKWTPAVPDANSIAVIVTHMCGSEAQWVHKYIGGRNVERNRDSEFKTPINTAKGLVEALDKAGAATRQALEKETSATLNRAVTSHNPAIAKNARDCVLHSLSHQATHIGHLEMTLQLWENRTH
ncbi:MAG: DUF1572 domain-containing protein [SAR202 cluster bacterium]|nr:DUF1572 domain-containing protein [SAR202 cluster bacterium]